MEKIYLYIVLLTLTGIIISCKDFTEGYTVDPVNPIVLDNLGVAMAGAQVNLIGTLEGELARNAGVWSRSFTGVQSQYSSLENYSNVTASNYDSPWGNIYDNTLVNLHSLKQNAIQQQDPNVVGIAQIMEAQLMGTATALFGDIPFSEAGRFPQIVNPKFDNQIDVYNGVQVLLDSGIANIQAAGPGGWEDRDIFYGGDLSKWLKVAYTLKARFYLHLKNYAQVVANASLGILSLDDNMMAPHGTAILADRNLYADFQDFSRPGYMNASDSYTITLLTTRNNLKTDETARLNYYFQDEDLNLAGFFAENAPFPLVTYEENILALAESQLALGNTPTALDSLNSYRAFLQNKFSSTYEPYELIDFEAGGLKNSSGVTVNDALLKEILEERYISLTGQIEVYNDIRRTKNLIGVPPVKGSEIPQRFLVAQNEINSNPNVPRPLPDLFQPVEAFK